MDERIRARIAVLQQNRDDHMLQVNLFNAAIGELEALVQPAAPEETESIPAQGPEPAL